MKGIGRCVGDIEMVSEWWRRLQYFIFGPGKNGRGGSAEAQGGTALPRFPEPSHGFSSPLVCRHQSR